jgi:hypothetical protein
MSTILTLWADKEALERSEKEVFSEALKKPKITLMFPRKSKITAYSHQNYSKKASARSGGLNWSPRFKASWF